MNKLSDEKMQHLMNLFKEKKIDELNIIVTDELKLLPRNVFLINLHGLISFAEEDFYTSINYFKECIKIKKSEKILEGIEGLYFNIAKSYLALNDQDRALENFIYSIEYDPNSIEKLEYIAKLYLVKEDYKNSLNYFNRLIVLDNSNSKYLSLKSDILIRMNESEMAKDVCNKIIEIDPNNYNAWNKLGNFSFEEGNYDDALEYFTWSNGILENNQGGLFGLARTYLHLKNIDDAKLACETLLTQKNIKPETYILYGDIFLVSGDFHSAEKYYKKSIKIDEINPKSYLYLANLYKIIYDYKKALIAINKCLSLNKELISAKKLAADINFKLKNFIDAKRYYSELSDIENILACLYCNNQRDDFNTLYNKNKNLLGDSRLISNILNHSNIVFNSNYKDCFCDKPFSFISSYNLDSPGKNDMNNELINLHNKIVNQDILNKKNINGLRYPGNIFNYDNASLNKLSTILLEKYNDYFKQFSNQDNNFINNHNKLPKLFGSFLTLDKNDSTQLISNTDPWLSGIYYLDHDNNEKSIINKFAIYNNLFSDNDFKIPNKEVEKNNFDLFLFPSSLSSQIISNNKPVIAIGFDYMF